jgi:hypothetical protein
MDIMSKLKFSSPETYTDKSDVDQPFYKDLVMFHWEDKDLPFPKDEYIGEDTQEYKKDPKVYQELDSLPQQAYTGVTSSKLCWSSLDKESEEFYDISPLNELNLYPSKRKDNEDYKKRNTKNDEEMIFEKGLHQNVERDESLRSEVPYK